MLECSTGLRQLTTTDLVAIIGAGSFALTGPLAPVHGFYGHHHSLLGPGEAVTGEPRSEDAS